MKLEGWKFWVFLVVACVAGGVLIEWAVRTWSPHTPTPGWEIVVCDECGGSGVVTYDEKHPLVVDWNQEPGTYTCPMCGGEGELEVRRDTL